MSSSTDDEGLMEELARAMGQVADVPDHRREAARAAFSWRTIDEELLPTFCEDPHRYMRSLREIRRYLELTPSALVVCGHDPECWPQVRERYE